MGGRLGGRGEECEDVVASRDSEEDGEAGELCGGEGMASLKDGPNQGKGKRVEQRKGADVEVGEEEDDRGDEPRAGRKEQESRDER